MSTLAEYLAEVIKRQNHLIHSHVDDLSQAETLAQPAGGNNLNWVLGHIAAHREKMMRALSLTTPWEADTYARYDRGSAPLVDHAEALDVVQVLTDLDESEALIVAWLAQADARVMDVIPEGARRSTGGQLGFLIWHEGYHAGQIEQLRHVAGRHEAIIE